MTNTKMKYTNIINFNEWINHSPLIIESFPCSLSYMTVLF